MIARIVAPWLLPHRKILTGIYLSMAIFLVAEIVVFWNDAVHALGDYLSGGGVAAYIALVLAYGTPVSCAAIAYLVHRRTMSLWMILLVAHTVFIFMFAVLPAMYLLWWYWRTGTDSGNGKS